MNYASNSVIKFPQEGKLITVDQLLFFTSSSEKNVPYVDQIPSPLDSVGPGLFKYPTRMGIFPLLPPNTIQVNMISWLDDPWMVPFPE